MCACLLSNTKEKAHERLDCIGGAFLNTGIKIIAVQRNYFGIVNPNRCQQLRDALFTPVPRPEHALPDNEPTDDKPTAIP